ncbi:MAG: glycosyltransferase family 2 protein [Pseudomonadota bacterium]
MVEFGDEQYSFTVFTSAYNREHTIRRVYESLLRQTCNDFEWLIADAGSDDTGIVIRRCMEEKPFFPIRYRRRDNNGKHGAVNYGVLEARGELFVILDDDDELLPEALERLKHHWQAIPAGEKKGFAGVAALSVDEKGLAVGPPFPQDVFDSTFSELTYRLKLEGERLFCLTTQAMRRYPFPEDIRTPTIPEGTIWHRISGPYRIRFVNEVLRRYWRDQPSVIRGGKARVYAAGNRVRYLVALNEEISWFRHAAVTFLIMAAQYTRFSLHLGIGFRDQWKDLKNRTARILWMISLPAGLAKYRMDDAERATKSPTPDTRSRHGT